MTFYIRFDLYAAVDGSGNAKVFLGKGENARLSFRSFNGEYMIISCLFRSLQEGAGQKSCYFANACLYEAPPWAALVPVHVIVEGEGAVCRTIGALHGDAEQGGQETGRTRNVWIEVWGDGIPFLASLHDIPRPVCISAFDVFADAFGRKEEAGDVFLGNAEGYEEADNQAGSSGFGQVTAV